MTNNSMQNLTNKLKEKRQARENEMEAKYMHAVADLENNLIEGLTLTEQNCTEELNKATTRTLKRLNAAGTTIERNTNQLIKSLKIHWRISLFYILPLYLLPFPILIFLYYALDTWIKPRVETLADHQTQISRLAAPGLKVWKGEGRMQVMVKPKEYKKPSVFVGEESGRWIVEIERK